MDWTEVPATAVTLQIPCLHIRKTLYSRDSDSNLMYLGHSAQRMSSVPSEWYRGPSKALQLLANHITPFVIYYLIAKIELSRAATLKNQGPRLWMLRFPFRLGPTARYTTNLILSRFQRASFYSQRLCYPHIISKIMFLFIHDITFYWRTKPITLGAILCQV